MAHIPSPSRTEMWVVEPSRSPAARSSAGRVEQLPRRAPHVERLGELLAPGAGWRPPSPRPAARARCARPAARAGRGSRRSGSRPRRAAGWSGPRCRGRRPGSARARSPRRRRGRRPRACRPARRRIGDRRRDLASVERLRPLGAEPFELLRQLRKSETSRPRAAVPARRVELAGPLEPAVDRGEDVEDVGLLGVDRRPLAGEPMPSPTSSASGIEPNRSSARARPAAVPGTPQEAGPT